MHTPIGGCHALCSHVYFRDHSMVTVFLSYGKNISCNCIVGGSMLDGVLYYMGVIELITLALVLWFIYMSNFGV